LAEKGKGAEDMDSTRHSEFAKLVDLVEDRLEASERQEIDTHLAACPACAAQRAKLEKTLSLMRARELEEAPRQTIARAVNLFRSRRQPAASLLERLVAFLTFDSRQMTPAFGVRSAAEAAERQMWFTAGDQELHLQISHSADQWIISGQVLGDCLGGTVELKNAAFSWQTPLNELCEFTLPAVAAGDYALTLRLGSIEIEVPNLNLGA
jgi:hypothetical protein